MFTLQPSVVDSTLVNSATTTVSYVYRNLEYELLPCCRSYPKIIKYKLFYVRAYISVFICDLYECNYLWNSEATYGCNKNK